jgi:hypothetical protein
MGNNTWDNLLDPYPVARGAAKNTFTAYQDVSPLPLPASYANELKLGTKVVIEACGEYSCNTGVTLQIGAIHGATAGQAGGVAIAQSAVITTGTTPVAWSWHYRYQGLITAVGVSGVLYGQAVLDLGTSLTALSSSPCPVTAAARSATIDTTVFKLWGVGATWGTSAAANTITVDDFRVQIMNQGKT